MKSCWQKRISCNPEEKNKKSYILKDNRGTKFWLFIGKVDSQGFVLLEILYPRKLAAISAWCCQTVLQNLRFRMKEGGGKAKQTENPLYPAAAEKILRNSVWPGLYSCLESAISLKQYLWGERTVLVISMHVRYEAWHVYTTASSFQCFFWGKSPCCACCLRKYLLRTQETN